MKYIYNMPANYFYGITRYQSIYMCVAPLLLCNYDLAN